jgi:hypothetical protein
VDTGVLVGPYRISQIVALSVALLLALILARYRHDNGLA